MKFEFKKNIEDQNIIIYEFSISIINYFQVTPDKKLHKSFFTKVGKFKFLKKEKTIEIVQDETDEFFHKRFNLTKILLDKMLEFETPRYPNFFSLQLET